MVSYSTLNILQCTSEPNGHVYILNINVVVVVVFFKPVITPLYIFDKKNNSNKKLFPHKTSHMI